MRIGEHPQVGSILANQLAWVELPELVVISGPNGAGKTNLLTGLGPLGSIPSDLVSEPNHRARDVRLFLTGELMLSATGAVTPANLRDHWAQGFSHIQNLAAQAKQMPYLTTDDQREGWVHQSVVDNGIFTPETVNRLVEVLDTPLTSMTVEQFREAGPLMASVVDPFAAHLGEIFVSWALRQEENDLATYRSKELGRDVRFLTQEEFGARFGRPPWEVLSETLRLIGLPYQFVAPSADELALDYSARLRHDDGTLVSTDALSSGERVLVAIALSLFAGSWETESVRLPKLLLLDEPDASLHPSMAQSLLTILQEVFVRRFGVSVILTTHSPTTVALADEDSLYIMRRSAPRLQKATSVDEALQELTVGVPTLSVRIENRRQVFVEAEDDQDLYGRIFGILRTSLSTPRTAEFVAVGKKSVGGGVDAVVRIVDDLRSRGVDTILGLIDRDVKTSPPSPHVHMLAERYSIENLIADPLLLGVFMLRESYASATELGLSVGTTHMDLGPTHMQPLVDAVTSAVGLVGDPIPIAYMNGETVDVPREYLEFNGHDLADPGQLVFQTWPSLNATQHKGLMSEIVRAAMVDHPGFIPRSVAELFERMLA